MSADILFSGTLHTKPLTYQYWRPSPFGILKLYLPKMWKLQSLVRLICANTAATCQDEMPFAVTVHRAKMFLFTQTSRVNKMLLSYKQDV